MKFTLEIEVDDENVTVGMVRDALEYDDNWPNLTSRTGPLNVIDVNGLTVGQWAVGEALASDGSPRVLDAATKGREEWKENA